MPSSQSSPRALLIGALGDALSRLAPAAGAPVEEVAGELRRASALVDLVAPLFPLRTSRWLRGCLGRARRRLRKLEREAAWRSSLEGIVAGATSRPRAGSEPLPGAATAAAVALSALSRADASQAAEARRVGALADSRREVAGALEIFEANLDADLDWDEVAESLTQSAFRVRDAARRALRRPRPDRVARLHRHLSTLDDQLEATGAGATALAEAFAVAGDDEALEALAVTRVLLARWDVIRQARAAASRRVERAATPSERTTIATIEVALAGQQRMLRDRALGVLAADLIASTTQGERPSSH